MINDSIVLDLFAGSGSLGIEALSNGASKVYFNDKNKECIKIIKDNLNNFNILNNSNLTNMDYEEALSFYKNKEIKFDLVFLDPPYKNHVIEKIIDYIIKNNMLNDNGLIVCELDNNYDISSGYHSFKEKRYGDKKIIIYKNHK